MKSNRLGDEPDFEFLFRLDPTKNHSHAIGVIRAAESRSLRKLLEIWTIVAEKGDK
jgi:hypothetical protein